MSSSRLNKVTDAKGLAQSRCSINMLGFHLSLVSVDLQTHCSLTSCREEHSICCFPSQHFQLGPHTQLSVHTSGVEWSRSYAGSVGSGHTQCESLHTGSTSLFLGHISADWLPDWACSFQSHSTACVAQTIRLSNEGPFLFQKSILSNSTRNAHGPIKSIYSFLR